MSSHTISNCFRSFNYLLLLIFQRKSDQNLAVGRLMRTLFPRPLMFTDDMEVSVKKYLHVDGPASAGYTLVSNSINRPQLATLW